MSTTSLQTIFIGSYTAKDTPGIHVAQFNSDSGEIRLKKSFVGIENPSFLVVHPNGRFLYAVSEIGQGSHGEHGSVTALQYNPSNHSLEKLNQQTTQGDWPCHLTLDQSGRYLVASNYGSGNAALYPILDDGRLGELIALLQHEGSGPNPDRQEGPHAHSAIFSPDNTYLIVADLGIDRLVIYRFDADKGQIQKQGEVIANPGSGPRHMVFHPNGRFLYVANELDSTVTRYDFDSTAGKLSPMDTVSTLTSPNPESFVADIHLSPDGSHLLVSNRGDNSLALFELAEDGRLSLQVTPSCGGNWPRNFALAKNGRFALVGNRRSNQVSILKFDNEGVGVSLKSQLACHEPSCIKFL